MLKKAHIKRKKSPNIEKKVFQKKKIGTKHLTKYALTWTIKKIRSYFNRSWKRLATKARNDHECGENAEIYVNCKRKFKLFLKVTRDQLLLKERKHVLHKVYIL